MTLLKFYTPSEHLAADKVTVVFRGRVIFIQYIPKKHKCFSIKLYKLCDSTHDTFYMKVYIEKGKQRKAYDLKAMHATVTKLTQKVEGQSHKLYMNNFFSSPNLFDNLTKKKINCCVDCKTKQEGI
jgi:hypothetical protein